MELRLVEKRTLGIHHAEGGTDRRQAGPGLVAPQVCVSLESQKVGVLDHCPGCLYGGEAFIQILESFFGAPEHCERPAAEHPCHSYSIWKTVLRADFQRAIRPEPGLL